ncbi:MAG: hypothetical protein IPH68_14080 [Chitinophagaceae bacterium]|nr:hypothetical protein [Chitinophagaceae bacterium]MBK7123809.1 hypothetical protein [Chitinophagaceae bacterium]MBK7556919.1 hypothetical protein [Chitinophagaceae bacterium]MBK9533515.1 hypothetical protein [Chitinophagaceae bacterium]
MEKSKKANSKRVIVTGVLWVITYTLSLLAIKKLSPGATTGVLISFLPVITFAVFIYSMIKEAAAMDEVQVRIHLEATVIAFSLGLLMLMTLGLLDLVVSLNKEDWGYRHLVTWFTMFYFTGLYISKRKYNAQ